MAPVALALPPPCSALEAEAERGLKIPFTWNKSVTRAPVKCWSMAPRPDHPTDEGHHGTARPTSEPQDAAATITVEDAFTGSGAGALPE